MSTTSTIPLCTMCNQQNATIMGLCGTCFTSTTQTIAPLLCYQCGKNPAQTTSQGSFVDIGRCSSCVAAGPAPIPHSPSIPAAAAERKLGGPDFNPQDILVGILPVLIPLYVKQLKERARTEHAERKAILASEAEHWLATAATAKELGETTLYVEALRKARAALGLRDKPRGAA